MIESLWQVGHLYQQIWNPQLWLTMISDPVVQNQPNLDATESMFLLHMGGFLWMHFRFFQKLEMHLKGFRQTFWDTGWRSQKSPDTIGGHVQLPPEVLFYHGSCYMQISTSTGIPGIEPSPRSDYWFRVLVIVTHDVIDFKCIFKCKVMYFVLTQFTCPFILNFGMYSFTWISPVIFNLFSSWMVVSLPGKWLHLWQVFPPPP